jgi:hypothetical protein
VRTAYPEYRSLRQFRLTGTFTLSYQMERSWDLFSDGANCPTGKPYRSQINDDREDGNSGD